MSSESDVDLILIGKTGHGKSSTANSILGKEAFLVSDGAQSETNISEVSWARRLNRIIKVVDTPGVCETRLSKGEAAKKMSQDMSQGIMQCPDGFHALVLTLKYGNRFTEEELSTVENLKSLFGPTFVKEYCIVIFTHGELFDMNNRKTPNKTFQDWCREQKGNLQTLLQECDYKVILFRNLSDNDDSQLAELLAMVDNFKSKGVRYTNEIFKKAKAAREQMIVRENAPILREEIQAKINLLLDGVEKVKGKKELTVEVQEILQQLKGDARKLENEISIQDKGTGVLDSLKQVVLNVQQNISSHEEALKQSQNKAQMEDALNEVQEKYDQSQKQLQKELDKAKEGDFFSKLLKGICGALAVVLPGPLKAIPLIAMAASEGKI